MSLISLKNIHKNFDNLPIINDVSLEINSREIVALIGPSGSGKSTLLNIIAGLTLHDTGEIAANNARISYLFQEDRLLPWLTVYENIKLVKDSGTEEEIDYLLDAVELKYFQNYYPKELSGGMRQRVAIARAFYYGADVLLMDEPYKALDYRLRLQMLTMLNGILAKQHLAVILVTHDAAEAVAIADRIIVFSPRPAHIIDEIILPPRRGSLRNPHDAEYQAIINRLYNLI